jgi:RNA polymerase sigma factor (TIGR02999 family)
MLNIVKLLGVAVHPPCTEGSDVRRETATRKRLFFSGPARRLAAAARSSIMAVVQPSDEVTRIIHDLQARGAAAEPDLFEATWNDLRGLAGMLMAGEAAGHTLQPTALVNEAYLKLVGGAPMEWNDRRHFINTVARAMRQVLVDRARRKRRMRHGGGRRRVRLADFDPAGTALFPMERTEELEAAIGRLESSDPRCAEIVHLRFFTGLTVEQTAQMMDVSPALVKKEWSFARSWLKQALEGAERAEADGGDEARRSSPRPRGLTTGTC